MRVVIAFRRNKYTSESGSRLINVSDIRSDCFRNYDWQFVRHLSPINSQSRNVGSRILETFFFLHVVTYRTAREGNLFSTQNVY